MSVTPAKAQRSSKVEASLDAKTHSEALLKPLTLNDHTPQVYSVALSLPTLSAFANASRNASNFNAVIVSNLASKEKYFRSQDERAQIALNTDLFKL